MDWVALHRRLARADPSGGLRWLTWLLTPPSLGYELAVRLRNTAYDAALLPVHRLSIPAISVGGLSAGGSGKTPLAAHLALQIAGWGGRPLLVAHGYGVPRTTRGVALIAPGVDSPRPQWRDVGEETLLLSRLAPGVPVIVTRHRERAYALARESGFDPTALVIDGGFQCRRLACDLNIVTLDSSTPPERGRLLPRGDLREPWGSLRRCDALVLHRAELCEDRGAWGRFLDRQAPAVRRAWCANRWGEPAEISSGRVWAWSELREKRVGVWTALGHPEAFLRGLTSRGVEPIGPLLARDHAPFDGATAAQLCALARRERLDGFLITAKDAVKIEPHAGELPAMLVVPAQIDWVAGGAELLAMVRATLG